MGGGGVMFRREVGGHAPKAFSALWSECNADIVAREAAGWVLVPATYSITDNEAAQSISAAYEMLPPEDPRTAVLRTNRVDLREKG